MQPSNILMALSALFLGTAQASPTPEKNLNLHPKGHITVEFYNGYGKSYTEKVWPDGDEHWFSKSSTPICRFKNSYIFGVQVNVQCADVLTQQTRARTTGRGTSTSSSSSTTRSGRTERFGVSQHTLTTLGTHSRSRSSFSCLTSITRRSSASTWSTRSPSRLSDVTFHDVNASLSRGYGDARHGSMHCAFLIRATARDTVFRYTHFAKMRSIDTTSPIRTLELL